MDLKKTPKTKHRRTQLRPGYHRFITAILVSSAMEEETFEAGFDAQPFNNLKAAVNQHNRVSAAVDEYEYK